LNGLVELEKMMTGQKDVYYSEFDNIIELFLPDVSII